LHMARHEASDRGLEEVWGQGRHIPGRLALTIKNITCKAA
jgi:hypothetical protein